MSERAKRRAAKMADIADIRVSPPKNLLRQAGSAIASDSRLPIPDTRIRRRYKGRLIEVTVLVDGFELEGKKYPSLSAVAKAVTGSHWNGYRFFALREGERREAADRRNNR